MARTVVPLRDAMWLRVSPRRTVYDLDLFFDADAELRDFFEEPYSTLCVARYSAAYAALASGEKLRAI